MNHGNFSICQILWKLAKISQIVKKIKEKLATLENIF